MGINSQLKKREKRTKLKEDKFLFKDKSQNRKYTNHSRLSQILRRRVIKKLKSRGVFKVGGRGCNLCKTKELVSKYFEVYQLSKQQQDEFHKSLGLKENFFDNRYKEHEVYVYFIGNTKEGYVKIGHSNNPNKRLKSIQTGCPFRVDILHTIDDADIDVEKQLQKKFKLYNTVGEWFRYEGELKNYLEQITNIGNNGTRQ